MSFRPSISPRWARSSHFWYWWSSRGASAAAAEAEITFTGAEMLGRPTDTSISVKIVPDAASHSTTNLGQHRGCTRIRRRPCPLSGQPTTVVIRCPEPEYEISTYRMRYSDDGDDLGQPARALVLDPTGCGQHLQVRHHGLIQPEHPSGQCDHSDEHAERRGRECARLPSRPGRHLRHAQFSAQGTSLALRTPTSISFRSSTSSAGLPPIFLAVEPRAQELWATHPGRQ